MWSYLIHGSPEIQAVLFGLAGSFAVALLVGYKTRLVSIMSWFLLMSLHNRNFLVLHGGDTLLRAALFWACFCPGGNGMGWIIWPKLPHRPGQDACAPVQPSRISSKLPQCMCSPRS